MKILRKLLIGIIIIFGAYSIICLFLPSSITSERSKKMKVSKEVLFSLVSDVKEYQKWSPWKEKDVNAKYEFSPQTSGEGAWFSWIGNDEVGAGKLTNSKIWGTDSLQYDLEFEGQGKSVGKFILTNANDSILVRWNITAHFPFLFRVFGLFFDGMIGKDFESGLSRMEKVAMSMPSKKEFSKTNFPGLNYLGITDSCDVSNIGERYRIDYSDLMNEMKLNKLNQNGPVFAVNIRFDVKRQFLVFEAGIPVDAEPTTIKNKRIKFSKIPSQEVLVHDYYGNYTNMQSTYEAMFNYIAEKGLIQNGLSWESYVSDPEVEKDTAKWLTKIYIPIK